MNMIAYAAAFGDCAGEGVVDRKQLVEQRLPQDHEHDGGDDQEGQHRGVRHQPYLPGLHRVLFAVIDCNLFLRPDRICLIREYVSKSKQHSDQLEINRLVAVIGGFDFRL